MTLFYHIVQKKHWFYKPKIMYIARFQGVATTQIKVANLGSKPIPQSSPKLLQD